MLEIPKTVIATSDPLNLCNGFALFPTSESQRRSKGVSETKAGTIFDLENISIIVLRFSANAKYEVNMGFCGPGYAIKMECEGKSQNNVLELTVKDDELAAGMFFGLTISLSLNLMLDIIKINGIVWDGWHTHLETSWKRLADVNVKLEFDVLEILFEVIMAAIGHTGANGEAFEKTFSETFKSSWGFYDSRINTFVKNNGEMAAYPGNNLQIDFSSKFPDMIPINAAMAAFHGHISFGPVFGYQIPVKVNMKSVTLGTTKYSGASFKADTGKINFTTTASQSPDATTMTVELQHTVGFDVTAGIFYNINIAKLFNIGASISFPLFDLLGWHPTIGGPYYNNLSNTIGKTTAKACSACGTTPTSLMEVIFETPAGLAL